MSLFPELPPPGVTLERRQFLQVSAAALAAWALGGCAKPEASGDHSPISFDDRKNLSINNCNIYG